MTKSEKIKLLIIFILIVLLIIFSSMLLALKANNIEQNIDNNSFSKEDIYREELMNIYNVEEKHVEHDEEGNRVNTSSKMKETVKITGIEGLQIEGLEIKSKDLNTTITGTVKNTSNDALGNVSIKISLNDEFGMQLVEMGAYIKTIEPGQTTTIQTSVFKDFTNAYSYTVSK